MQLELFLSQRSGVDLGSCLRCEASSEFDGSVMQITSSLRLVPCGTECSGCIYQ